MHRSEFRSLADALSARTPRDANWIASPSERIPLDALLNQETDADMVARFRNRSVLIATTEQLSAATALVALDGIARRLVLATPNLEPRHIEAVIETASVDIVLSDRHDRISGIETFDPGTIKVGADVERQPSEWILLTSGTTGAPKLVRHTLATLGGATDSGGNAVQTPVWSTFYDIRRYGGLQIFLRALLGGGSLLLSSPLETIADFLARAGAHGVTSISGTPSHWRNAIISPAIGRIDPDYVRLSGEVADQPILDALGLAYPKAHISHAFASTEAGVVLNVADGRAGFPAALAEARNGPVEIVIDGSLRVRSPRTALGYLGAGVPLLADADGFVDTGDLVERRGDRYVFLGRRDGTINVGGLKVHPEEVEAVLNDLPMVQQARVRSRKNAITGAIVFAEIVPKPGAPDKAQLEREILAGCRAVLPRHKVPAAIRFVPAIEMSAAGKLARADA